MAYYRYQVVSVGMWRGKIKRWNTTFHLAGSGTTSGVLETMQAVCYPNPGDAVGACSGGVASIAVYNPTGGPPISNTVYFDWQTPTTWIPFLGTAWSGIPAGTPVDASGESAVLVVGQMAKLSATGKPVTTRKYIHAVPSRTASAYGDPDVPTANATLIKAQFPISYMGTAAGVTPASVLVEPWYFNHQRVRGKRKPKAQVAAQSYAAGVTACAVSHAGGGTAPFQGGAQ